MDPELSASYRLNRSMANLTSRRGVTPARTGSDIMSLNSSRSMDPPLSASYLLNNKSICTSGKSTPKSAMASPNDDRGILPFESTSMEKNAVSSSESLKVTDLRCMLLVADDENKAVWDRLAGAARKANE